MRTIASRQLVLLSVVAGLVGCTLTRPAIRQGMALLPEIQEAGQVIQARQCALKFAIVAHPFEDETLGELLWNVADAQVVPDEARQALTANGICLGVITGELPVEVQEILDAPPPRQVDPATIILPDGDNTLVDLQAGSDEVALLLAVERNSIQGKRFSNAHGFYRVTANQSDDGVNLRLVPEVHHGESRQGWGVAPGGGSFAPQQFVMQTGQTEESFRDLATEITLQPGQVLVLSCLPSRRGSLGHFLLSAREPNSDRPLRKVVFFWASGGASDPGSSPRLPDTLLPDDPPEMPEITSLEPDPASPSMDRN